MYWTDDPVADAERHIAEKDKELKKLPKCCLCGEHIQDEYLYDMDGFLYCEDCIRHFRKAVENYA